MKWSTYKRQPPSQNNKSHRTVLAALFLIFVASGPVFAGPTTLPWSDGEDKSEIVTDEHGNKIKMSKAEKAAKAAELAPTLTMMLSDAEFPSYSTATTRIDLKYVVYLGGFHLSTLAFSTALNGTAYEIRSNIHTEGIVDKIVRTNATIGARGKLLDGRAQPELYNSDITDRNQRQLVAISYDGPMPTDVLSFPRYNLKKYPVSPLDKRKTVDPVSAIMQIAAAASKPDAPGTSTGTGNPCGGQIPIFDGRRRFNLNLEYEGTETMSSGKEAAYKGEALKCWVGFKKVAGYKPKKKKKWRSRTDGRSEWPDVYMWLAPLDGTDGLYMPIRFVAHTSFGAVVARAIKIDVTVIDEKQSLQHAEN